MVPALLTALSLLASDPATASPPAADTPAAHHGPRAVAASVAETAAAADEGDIPVGAPTDDYGFVSWCYGALDEYLAIYDVVIPDLKAIDQMFGTSVQEDQPYTSDIAAARVALKRFGAAIELAERASPAPIAEQGAADIQAGRRIWAQARQQPHRKLADAWLFWGVPRRCETAAKAIKTHAAGSHLQAQAGPSAIQLAAAEPAATLAPAPAAPPAPPQPTVPAGPPPRAGAAVIDSR